MSEQVQAPDTARDWNTVAHEREAAGRCPNCNQPVGNWLVEHGDGDDGFTCPRAGSEPNRKGD